MSVVKKYQNGGNVPNQYSDYSQFLASELEKHNFKTKAGRYSGQIPLWEKFVQSGEAAKSLVSDPISKGYMIKAENLSPEFQGLAGSDKPVRTNLFGQISVNNAEDMNSVIADITKRYLAGKQTSISQAPIKQKVSLGDLSDYMKEKVYNNNEDWQNMWEARKKTLGSEEAIKNELKKYAGDYINWYKGKITSPEEGFEYSPIDKEEQFSEALQKDWGTFVPEANRLGWNIARLAEFTPTQQEEQAINAQEALKKQLIAKGFGISEAESIARGNEYTSVLPDLGINDAPWLTEAIKNYTILHNPQNKRTIVVNPLTGQPIEDIIFKDPDAPGYGTYFTQAKGVPTLFRPGQEGYQQELFADPAKSFGAARPIVGTVNGQSTEIIGHPEELDGQTSYINKLIIKDPVSGEYLEVHRTQEGKYIDPVTKKEHIVDIKEYGDFSEDTYPAYYKFSAKGYKDVFDPIQPIASTRSISEIEQEELPLKNTNDPAYAKTLGELKYLMNNGKTLLEKWEAARIYRDKLALLENNKASVEGILRAAGKPIETSEDSFMSVSKNINKFLRNLVKGNLIYKDGGVLKLQSGNKFSIKNIPTEKLQKIKDLRGTVYDMSRLDKASLLSSGVSIIPGLGVVGGLSTTVLDAMSDIEKTGKIDYGNLAVNLGFSGLSLIGLGGVGAAAKTARLAKMAAKMEDAASNLNKLKNVAKTTQGISKPISVEGIHNFSILKSGLQKLASAKAGTLKDAGLNVAELKALKQSNILNKSTSLTTTLGKSVAGKASETLGKLKSPIKIDAKTVRSLVPKTGNIRTNIPFSEVINPKLRKAANVTAVGTMALPTISSVGSIAADIKEGGFENIKHEDLKNALLASGVASKYFANKSLAKDIQKVIKKTTTKPSFKIGDKEFSVKDVSKLEVPKEAKPVFGKFRKKASETKNAKTLEDFKKTFKEQTGQDLPEGTQLGEIESIAGKLKTKGLYKPSDMTTKRYERAMKEINKFKTGGILKFQNSGKLPITGGPLKGKMQLPSVDLHNLLNTAAFLKANQATDKAIKSPIQGALVIPQLSTLSRQHMRQSAPFSPIAEKQAGMIHSSAGRLAKSLSDVDKATAVMLSGMAQGSDLKEKATLNDQEALEKLKMAQMQSDRQTDLTNLDIATKNKLAVAEAEQRVHGLQAAKAIGLNQNLQNYLQSLGRAIERKQEEKKYKNYYDLATSPESANYIKEMENLQKKTVKSKKDWLEARKNLGPVKIGEETWEDTYGKIFSEEAEVINKKLADFQRKLSGANLAMQLPGLKLAKGGSLEEKKELARYKYNLSKKDKEQKEFYKLILKNNEMMLKTLSRIFK